jgi:hypothetical protein
VSDTVINKLCRDWAWRLEAGERIVIRWTATDPDGNGGVSFMACVEPNTDARLAMTSVVNALAADDFADKIRQMREVVGDNVFGAMLFPHIKILTQDDGGAQ